MTIRLVAFDCKINTVWSKTNVFEDPYVLLIKSQRVVLFQFLDSNTDNGFPGLFTDRAYPLFPF